MKIRDSQREVPKDGWICFFCGEVCRTVQEARDHFGYTGPDENEQAACILKLDAGEKKIMHALREAWDELARYWQEDSDMDRKLSAIEADHQRALRRAEEEGYAKGLRDSRRDNLQ